MSGITAQELLDCALPSWYPCFQHITIKSEFIELSQSFVDYLGSDGVILPQGCELPLTTQSEETEEEEWSEDDHQPEQSDPLPDHQSDPPSFPDVVHHISCAISSLGASGKGVVPKLNWSVPQDAVWISPTNTLCCMCPAEVILLLKSSDFIAHDISRVSEYNTTRPPTLPPLNCTLCLREWRDFPPSSEFRCFVRNGDVIGACQRDPSTHYPFLSPIGEQLLQEFISFHKQQLKSRMSALRYTFDVYREKVDKLVLVDLNPFPMTDPLLFLWEELETWSGHPELRLVESDSTIQPAPHQTYRLPKDIVDLSTGEDIHKFVDLFQSNHPNSN